MGLAPASGGPTEASAQASSTVTPERLGAVTGGTQAGGPLGTAQLTDGAVAAAAPGSGAVRTALLADGAVTAQRRDTTRRRRSLFAIAGTGGELAAGRGAITADRPAIGTDRVSFDRDVTRCALSVVRAATPGETAVLPDATDPDRVLADVGDSAEAAENQAVQLVGVR